MIKRLSSFAGLFAVLAFLHGCVETPETPEAPTLVLTPAGFDSLPGWQQDQQGAALISFAQSCKGFARRPDSRKLTGLAAAAGDYGKWKPICAAATSVLVDDHAAARAFFETWLQPYRVDKSASGLFTGYYEPLLQGSRQKSGPYQTPLLRRPNDLITVNLGDFKDDLKGDRIVGRVEKNRLKPYYDRAEIEAGKIDKDDLAIVYVDDPVDAFFLQIQGSGRVALAEGGEARIGYAAQNGRRYYAIGRELFKRGELEKGKISLQSIRAWLAANPDKAQEIMNTNPSFVFFEEKNGPGPIGAFGVPLTPGRSLAVDRKLIPLGVPVWLATDVPDAANPARKSRYQRLMIAQDTGGAIKGTVRGDIFFGHGPVAEIQAGHMKSPGSWFLLLPK